MPRPNRGFRIGDKPVKGVWYIVWTEQGRSQRASTFTGDRREADRYFGKWLRDLESAAEEHDGPVVPTVAQVMRAYRDGHLIENELPSGHQCRVNTLMIEHHKIGERPATEVTPEDVKLYGRDRAAGKVGYTDGEGVKRGYRKGGSACFKNEIAALNAALRWCVANRKFSGLTLASLHPAPVPAGPPPRSHYLTLEQAMAVLEYARRQAEEGNMRERYVPLYLFILIALDTASRKDVIEKLTWDRVELWQDEAGAWGGQINFQDPARRVTKKRRGVNDLSAETAEILARYRDKAKTRFVLVTDGARKKAFRTATKTVLGKAHGPHILRHSWATWAVSNGVPLVEVAAVLHDTMETVSRVYGHLLPEKRRQAVNLVAQLRQGARPVANDDAAPAENAARTAKAGA